MFSCYLTDLLGEEFYRIVKENYFFAYSKKVNTFNFLTLFCNIINRKKLLHLGALRFRI